MPTAAESTGGKIQTPHTQEGKVSPSSLHLARLL